MSSVLHPKERRRGGSSLVHWVRSMIAFLPRSLSKEEIVAKKGYPLFPTDQKRKKDVRLGFEMKPSQRPNMLLPPAQ